ncbi:MAG: SDR family oxidoreductase [Dorea sp.]|jgi:NAD(P)-dependent dehydrogenase (short-subunit alcohol dehydrogenase family)|nr:SDR family oxidoreductase [Dorea sp.]
MKKVWFITGAAKGIGYAIAKAALEAGDCVVATTRKENDFIIPSGYENNALHLLLDISNQDLSAYTNAVEQAVQHFGRIDILVNNAGYARISYFEETSEESLKEIFEVNFFGLMRVTRAVLPVMRKQRSGHIFNIASSAGYSHGPVPYHSSKFAVTGFSTALAFEVAPFGIKLTNVIPGFVRTNFYDKGAIKDKADITIADYNRFRWQSNFVKKNRRHEQAGDPDKVAKLIVEASRAAKAPLHLPVTADAVKILKEWQQGIGACVEEWCDKANDTSFDE